MPSQIHIHIYVYIRTDLLQILRNTGLFTTYTHTHTHTMAAYGLMFLLLLILLLLSSAPLVIICQQQTFAAATALNDPWKHDGRRSALYDDEEEAGEESYAKSYRHGYDDEDEKQYQAPPSARHHDDRDGARSHRGGHRHSFVLDIDDDRSSSLIHTTVFHTEAGEMKFLSPRDSTDDHDNHDNELARQRIGLSFLTLEPNALLLPHYTDSDCLFVVNKGFLPFCFSV